MRSIQSFACLLVSSIILSWLVAGCKGGANDGTDPQTACRIQRIVSTLTGGLGTMGTDETVFTYDPAGNLLKKTKTSETNSLSVSDKTTTTDTYTYNADSFLTTSTSTIGQHVDFFGKSSDYQLTSIKTYTYANDRLVGYTQNDKVFSSSLTGSPQQQTTVVTGTYEYDAVGQLIKQTTSAGESWTYQNGRAITHSGAYPYTLQDGLIIKASFPGTNSAGKPLTLVQVDQYDDQRRLIKHQEFLNDSLSMYYTQEWQSGKPATSAVPTFKGHPVLQSVSGEVGVPTKYRAYSANNQGTLTQYTESTYTNQLNAQGFVTTNKLERMNFFNGQKQPDVTTTVYTYTGCN